MYVVVVKSSLFANIIPQIYVFPEFIYWLVSTLYPKKCFVMNALGENIFQISALLIQQTLVFPHSNLYTPFSKEALLPSFQNLSRKDYTQMILFLMPTWQQLPIEPTQFSPETFIEDVRPFLQIIAKVLGMEDTTINYRAIFGMFNLILQHVNVLDLPAYWEKMVNSKLSELALTGCLIFPSLVAYLFMYTHVESFMYLGLNTMDVHKKRQSIVIWIDTLRIHSNYEVFTYFTSSFM